MSVDWSRLDPILAAAKRVLLVSHMRPDCDALGSELGMALVLESRGKHVRIVNGQPTPPNLEFLDPTGRIQALGVDVAARELDDVDLVIVLDTSAWAQLGPMANVVRSTQAKKIVIDHHVSADDLSAELLKEPGAEATGRLVVEVADHLGVPFTPEIATPLLAAIATDTGWFRFRSTRGDTLRVAGRLIDAGADPQAIYTSLYEQETAARVRLRGRILSRVQTELDGRLVHTAALREDFDATGALPGDTEDVINLTLQIKGADVAVIFVSLPAGGFKISLRSRSQLDCSKLAEQFGGGGHKAAAGASLEGTFEQVQARVLGAVRAAMGK